MRINRNNFLRYVAALAFILSSISIILYCYMSYRNNTHSDANVPISHPRIRETGIPPELPPDRDFGKYDGGAKTAATFCFTKSGKYIPCPLSDKEKAEELAAKKLKIQTDEIRSRLSNIPAFYNTPNTVPYKGSVSITFVLETQGKGSAITLTENLKGKIVSTEVLAGPEVQAVLTGPTELVEITFRGPIELQRKTVSAIAPVQWTWDVKGIGIGTANLQLELLAFIQKNQKSSPVQVRTFHQSIPVEISLYDSIINYINDFNPVWVFLGTIITGIGGLLTWFNLKPAPRKSNTN